MRSNQSPPSSAAAFSGSSRSPRRSGAPPDINIPPSRNSSTNTSPGSVTRENFPPDDARAMSPRRDTTTTERMSREARGEVEAQARSLRASVLALDERVHQVRTEHERLESGNRFLESYIGELMAASRITAPGAAGSGSNSGTSAIPPGSSGGGSDPGKRRK